MNPIPHCTSIMRGARAGSAHRDTFLFILAGLALALIGANNAWAAHALTVESATLTGNTLTVTGDHVGGNPTVLVGVFEPDGVTPITGSPFTAILTGQGSIRTYALAPTDRDIGEELACIVSVTQSSPNRECTEGCPATVLDSGTGQPPARCQPPNLTARGDSYTTPRGNDLSVVANRLSGLLYNDFDTDADGNNIGNGGLTVLTTTALGGRVSIQSTGAFNYSPPNATFQGDEQFTYTVSDGDPDTVDATATVNVRVLPKQTDFKFMMNYELGMHCTGFEFAYCCVLPVYNSIITQVVKPENQQGDIEDWTSEDLVRLMEGDPNVGRNLDVLGRETVIRDPSLDADGNFNKYVVKYWHDAQSRNDGQGKPQVGNPALQANLPPYLNTTTLISDVEGNTLLSWNTRADAACENLPDNSCFNPEKPLGALILGPAEGGAAVGVVQGDGSFDTTGNTFIVNVDNYQNAIWNHLYIFEKSADGVEGVRLCAEPDSSAGRHCFTDAECDSVQEPPSRDGVCGDSTELNKERLGLDVDYPTNFGPGGHPMGPVSGDADADGIPDFNDNAFMTFSGDTGTVVYTQMKLVENLPVMLTSPRIWEALGLPLTPFEDTLGFFQDPGLVDEDSIRPYVQMMAQLHEADCGGDPVNPANCVAGAAVLDSLGNPVQGFGDAPIDIPNCERCHSAFDTQNSPNDTMENPVESALVQLEIDFWMAYYDITAGESDWYARLKGAAISILARHDADHNTQFLGNYPAFPRAEASDPFDPVTELGGLSQPLPGAPANCLVNKRPTGPSCSSHADCPTTGQNPTDGVCDLPQNTRIGHESVLCHKCHADNVIAVVKSTECGPTGTTADAEGNITPCTGELIPSLTDSLHFNHRSVSEGGPITFSDGLGRDGSCQGCHPAHRSDGVMDGYPIDLDGNNTQAAPINPDTGLPEFDVTKDNRLSPGGCFVGRDVHSNPFKDVDVGDTPSYLTVLGEYLRDEVAFDSDDPDSRGIWCTNCHSQAGQQMWKTENCPDLINGDCIVNPRAARSMQELADMIVTREPNAAARLATLESWADPKDPGIDPRLPLSGPNARLATGDDTYAIWRPDAGLCNYVAEWAGAGTLPDSETFNLSEISAEYDGAVALVEVAIPALGGSIEQCQTGDVLRGPDGQPFSLCGEGTLAPPFFICGSYDADGDFTAALTEPGLLPNGDACDPNADPAIPDCVGQSVFCTTQDCKVAADEVLFAANAGNKGNTVAQIPFGTSDITTATDGRDHWLSPGEPHCADCHQAPYTEQSGNINPFPPFNYPRKASLMRYSRGHQDVTCQGCHESIHGLYPVTPTIDNTSYAQAAALNHDGSHGPLKCGACHRIDEATGTPMWHEENNDGPFDFGTYDNAVGWAHTFTDEADPRPDLCRNCHGNFSNRIDVEEEEWLEHSMKGRVTRNMMDKAEKAENNGFVFGGAPGEDPLETVCQGCHGDESGELAEDGCTVEDGEWLLHLTEGRVAASVWEDVSSQLIDGQPAADGTICGW